MAEGYYASQILGRNNYGLNCLDLGRSLISLRSKPLMTGLLLTSPHPQDAHSWPFCRTKTSIDCYFMCWKYVSCYCMNFLPLE